MEITNFDQTEVFNTLILPRLREVIAGCSMYKIPCVFMAAIKEEESETTYHTEIVPPASSDRKLSDDKIADMIKLSHGYTVSMPIELPSEFDE